MNKKDFDRWNELKKQMQDRRTNLYCKQRQVWWCSVGVNIGSEEDGKGDLFRRPVIILKVFSIEMVRIASITSNVRQDNNHVSINYNGKTSSVILSQVRTVSTKRLFEKICRLDRDQFDLVVNRLQENLV